MSSETNAAGPIEAPMFAHTNVDKVCLSIFFKIVNVLDFHFQGQKFDSSTLKVHTQTAIEDIAIANAQEVTSVLSIGIFIFDLCSF